LFAVFIIQEAQFILQYFKPGKVAFIVNKRTIRRPESLTWLKFQTMPLFFFKENEIGSGIGIV